VKRGAKGERRKRKWGERKIAPKRRSGDSAQRLEDRELVLKGGEGW